MKFSVRACAYNHLIDPFKGISVVEVQSAYNRRQLDMPTSERWSAFYMFTGQVHCTVGDLSASLCNFGWFVISYSHKFVI